MKQRLTIAALMLTAGTLMGTCSPAVAQFPSRYSPPAGPVLPNQLNYFRRDVGVLDPFNTFVQPRRQLNQQLNALNYQQQADTARIQQEIGNVRKSLAAPTGASAGFMNHGQYFNIPRGNQARR